MHGNMTEEEIKSENNGAQTEADNQPEQTSADAGPASEIESATPQNPNMKWYIIHTYSGSSAR